MRSSRRRHHGPALHSGTDSRANPTDGYVQFCTCTDFQRRTRKLCGASGSLLSCFTETLKWFDYSSWFLHCGEFKYILSVKLINIKNILTGMKLKCLLSVRILTFYLHSFIFHICTFPETMAFIFQLSTNSPDFQIFKLKSNTSTFIRKFFPFP